MEVPHKLKIELPYNPTTPLLDIYLEQNKNMNSKRYMHPRVHCSTIYNSPDTEATQMSINRQTDKENIIYMYNGILISHKKNEILPFEATWTDLENITLSETSQIKADTGDFPGDPVAKTVLPMKAAWVQSLVSKLEPTCNN